jgi:hypothetical protein
MVDHLPYPLNSREIEVPNQDHRAPLLVLKLPNSIKEFCKRGVHPGWWGDIAID